jgi:glyoxylase-like metal-dependent hydrolase (beta-lactamase superfamily II)
LLSLLFSLVEYKNPVDIFETDVFKKCGVDIIHCPGYTPGSLICLYKKEGGLLFNGDSLSGITSKDAPEVDTDSFPIRFVSIAPFHGKPSTKLNKREITNIMSILAQNLYQ